ncbi:MAG: hypothetical protein E7218_01760 [Anaerofustis stercorihominis]|nr:hypothetical protein [Anaerofustis stercorihominis]
MLDFYDYDDIYETPVYKDILSAITDTPTEYEELSDNTQKSIVEMLDTGEYIHTSFRINDISDITMQDYELALKTKSLAYEMLQKSEHGAEGLGKYSEYISDVANYRRDSGENFQGDLFHEIIAAKDGFNGIPHVLDEDEFEEASRGKTLLYRGLSASPDGKSAFEISEDFKYSDRFYHGLGLYGNGIYMSPREDIARCYSDGSYGSGITAFLDSDARIITYEDLLERKKRIDLDDGTDAGRLANEIISDNGRFAELCGYDAVSLDGYAGQEHILVLNRSKLTVKK